METIPRGLNKLLKNAHAAIGELEIGTYPEELLELYIAIPLYADIESDAKEPTVQADEGKDEFDFSHAESCNCFVCRKRHGRTA